MRPLIQIFGHSLELHPVVVLMALAFWFAIWGVVGAILSIPVTAVIRIVLSHSNHPYARIVIRLLEGVCVCESWTKAEGTAGALM